MLIDLKFVVLLQQLCVYLNFVIGHLILHLFLVKPEIIIQFNEFFIAFVSYFKKSSLFFLDQELGVCNLHNLLVNNVRHVCQLVIGQFVLDHNFFHVLIHRYHVSLQKHGLTRVNFDSFHLQVQKLDHSSRLDSLIFPLLHRIEQGQSDFFDHGLDIGQFHEFIVSRLHVLTEN